MPRINAVSFHEDPSIESICRRVRQAGFDSLEVSRPPFYAKLTTAGLRKRFATWAADSRLNLYGFDCWVEVDPYTAAADTLNAFRAAVEFAHQLELGMIITHDPWNSVNQDRSASACMERCVELFARVVEICQTADLQLVFEPHPDTLSMQNAWAIEFIDRLRASAANGMVGLVYDCCHYGVGQPATYVGTIAELGDRIRHVHFSDGDAKTYALHLPLGEGVLKLSAIVDALKAIPFTGTLTNDMYNYPLLDDGAARNAGRIREIEAALGLTGP